MCWCLPAIECRASVDIVRSDKTNRSMADKLSVYHLYAVEGKGVDINSMLAVAVLTLSHTIKVPDPIDG